MTVPDERPPQAVFGDPDTVAVRRAFADLRAGRPLIIADGPRRLAALPIDGADDAAIQQFRQRIAADRPSLAITDRRAAALGLRPHPVTILPLPADVTGDQLMHLASAEESYQGGPPSAGGAAEAAAIELTKLTGLLPAVLTASAAERVLNGIEAPLLSVEAGAIATFKHHLAYSFRRISEARVPLKGDIETRFVIYRDAIGRSAVAVIVGSPDFTGQIPVRVHSSCATGDIFGSRRCDCGDQLRIALDRIHRLGGGVIVYMDQEGRGLGLANKMRAYGLQDQGLDTVDANTTLGFHEDERDYAAAGCILADLDCSEIVLLTNNPLKVEALRAAGIDVTDRMPVLAPVHDDNRRYLEAKAERSGHLLGIVRSRA